MSSTQVIQAFAQCGKVLQALGIIINKPVDPERAYIDATIQRFEFTVELFWKLLKRLIEAKGSNVRYPKDVLQEAYAGKLIDDGTIWLQMLNDRNMTSHTYSEKLADEIYARVKNLLSSDAKNV